jgi:hypothetical protein
MTFLMLMIIIAIIKWRKKYLFAWTLCFSIIIKIISFKLNTEWFILNHDLDYETTRSFLMFVIIFSVAINCYSKVWLQTSPGFLLQNEIHRLFRKHRVEIKIEHYWWLTSSFQYWPILIWTGWTLTAMYEYKYYAGIHWEKQLVFNVLFI